MVRRLRIAHALLLLGDELDFDGDCSFDEDDDGSYGVFPAAIMLAS